MLFQKSVSVIIPVYNAEEFLERCIESVAQQSYGNLEIILVDDGSTDGSTAICREWEKKDKRVVYIRQKNAGDCAARNTGISAANAEYITFLDADDWFESEFIENVIADMIENRCDIGLCDMYYVDSKTMSREVVELRFDSPVVSCHEDKSVMNKSRLFAWGKIFKKELLDAFPTIAVYGDSCYIPIVIASANRISYTPKPLINYYRNRFESISNDFEKIGGISESLRLLFDRLHELGKYDEYAAEYKKIALGLLRIACRKWGENVAATDLLRDIECVIVELIPELGGISARKYFAFGSQILALALHKALPYARQVVLDIDSADGIVVFEDDLPLISGAVKQIITVPSVMKNLEKSTSNEFNIAEVIMEKL
jgi:glycosyltransferase involved in cell wall biosynthesis